MSRKRRAEERSRSRSPSSRSSSRSSQSHGSQDDEEDGIRLHVAGLGFGIRRRELQHIFEKYGDLREIWMARSPPCFAFVVYREKDDAEDAVKATDGIMLHGNQLRVTFARPRTRGRGRRGFDPNMRCYQCGYKGHFSRDCPDTKYGYKRPPSSTKEQLLIKELMSFLKEPALHKKSEFLHHLIFQKSIVQKFDVFGDALNKSKIIAQKLDAVC
ncbi:RNA-binding protein 1 [Gryllus bimaculatus]|nr:RNA-binding protein 1 [Gryllus bimaculatus]